MYDLSDLYHPLTARPAHGMEYVPCQALRPYIRCFWGGDQTVSQSTVHEEIIIPDTCMDIIWEMDEASGRTQTLFHGINDTPFEIHPEPAQRPTTLFGIRFHFWAVHFFADQPLSQVVNAHVDVEDYFGHFKRELGDRLASATSMQERICAATHYLLCRLEASRLRAGDSLMNAIYTLVHRKGVVTAEDLEGSTGLSSRHVARLFHEYVGLSPKKMANLVRFQNTWQELYLFSGNRAKVQDIVYAYRYTDQSHFNHNFKKYAGKTPLEALKAAGRCIGTGGEK